MDLLAKPSGGQNIVARPQALPRYYPAPEAPAATVDVYWTYDGETTSSAQFDGNYRLAGQTEGFNFTPDSDRDVRLYFVSRSSEGVPAFADLADAHQVVVPFNRSPAAPQVAQVGAATAEEVTIAVDDPEHGRFIRKRRLTVSPNADMSDASITVRDFGGGEVPRLLVLDRTAALVPDFTWSGGDPTASGFTKTGTGTTTASTSPSGWRVTTTGTDAATYYGRNLSASPFSAGFTLEILPPPSVVAADATGPSSAAAVEVDSGAHRYLLEFSATEVRLNGGTAHAHSGQRCRLVVAPGGTQADLWTGDTKAEDNTASLSSAAAGLRFGDLAGADDSESVWAALAYALTPQDVRLAETVYLTVAHSGGSTFGDESAPLAVTFANSGTGEGGSEGSGDLFYRDRYRYENEV